MPATVAPAGDDSASDGTGPFPSPNSPAPFGSACPGSDLLPTSQNLAQFSTALQCLVNQQRAEQSLGALDADPQLEAAAQHHVDDMIASGYFGHTSPSGETLRDRVFASGYAIAGRHYLAAEDLAWGTYGGSADAPDDTQVTPTAIVTGWMASATHRANILTPEFRDSGIAIDPQPPPELGGGQAGMTVALEFGVHS